MTSSDCVLQKLRKTPYCAKVLYRGNLSLGSIGVCALFTFSPSMSMSVLRDMVSLHLVLRCVPARQPCSQSACQCCFFSSPSIVMDSIPFALQVLWNLNTSRVVACCLSAVGPLFASLFRSPAWFMLMAPGNINETCRGHQRSQSGQDCVQRA